MNYEQMMGLARQVLPILGTLAASAGFITPEKVGPLTETVLQAAGPVMILGSMAWSMYSKTDKSIAANAAALPDVEKVVTKPTFAGIKLADSVPSEKVVAAKGPTPELNV